MKHKKAKATLIGVSPVKDAFAFTRHIIHQAKSFVKGFLKFFLKNLAKSKFFPENALTICKFRAIMLAYEQRRS